MDKHCRICHNTSCSNHGKNISFLGEGWKCNYIPVPTNADRIRAMSDEELAKMLKDYKDCSKNCIISNGKHCYQICEEESVLLKWLQQPAEGE